MSRGEREWGVLERPSSRKQQESLSFASLRNSRAFKKDARGSLPSRRLRQVAQELRARECAFFNRRRALILCLSFRERGSPARGKDGPLCANRCCRRGDSRTSLSLACLVSHSRTRARTPHYGERAVPETPGLERSRPRTPAPARNPKPPSHATSRRPSHLKSHTRVCSSSSSSAERQDDRTRRVASRPRKRHF